MENRLDYWMLIIVLMNINITKSEECTLKSQGLVDNICHAKITCKAETSITSLIDSWDCAPAEYYYDPHQRVLNRRQNYRIDLDLQQVEDLNLLPLKDVYNHIQVLNISGSPITSLPSIISTLEIVTDLNFSNNSIQSLKILLITNLKKLETLNVSWNELSNLEYDSNLEQSQSASILTYLDFSHNLLSDIPDNYFVQLPLLTYLDLSYNLIESFSVLTFEGVSRLKTLIVSHNKIKNIGFSLARFNNLEKLYLDSNTLTSLDVQNFNTMINLQKLNVNHNTISSIEAKCFDSLRSLKELDVSGNKIKQMVRNMFINNKFLDTLLLNDNFIETIEDNFLNGTNVTKFNIENNIVTGVINKNTFIGQFKVLNISNSKIQKVEAHAFSQAPLLQNLNLSSNIIQFLDKKALCFLTNLEILDLSYNNVSDLEFEKYDLKNLLYLNISNNRIVTIRNSTFEYLDQLKNLDISFNFIKTIENHSFKFIPKLLELKMEHNLIEIEINENTFNGLSSTKTINLSSSEISSIKNYSFSLKNLDMIDLSKNKISRLEYECFKGVPSVNLIQLSNNQLETFYINTQEVKSLRVLYLNDNKLTKITNETFAYLVNLEQLHLANNNIMTITPQQFSTLKSLKYLDLSHNNNIQSSQLNSIDNLTLNTLIIQNVSLNFDFVNSVNLTIFNLDISNNNIELFNTLHIHKIKKLSDLRLCKNKLPFVTKQYFPNMSHLVNLDLSFNNIDSIQPGAFLSTPKLKSLNLSHNSLKSLKYGVFDGLKYLQYLNISQNSLVNFQFELLLNLQAIDLLSLEQNKLTTLNIRGKNNMKFRHIFIGGNQFPCDFIIEIKSLHNFIVTAEVLDYHSENVDGITCISESKNVKVSDNSLNSTMIATLNELNKNINLLNKEVAAGKISSTYNATKDIDFKSLFTFLKDIQINYTKMLNETIDINLNKMNVAHNAFLMHLNKIKEQSYVNQTSIQNEPVKVELARDSNLQNYDFHSSWKKEFSRDTNKTYVNSDLKAILYFGTTCIAILTVISLWFVYKKTVVKTNSYHFNETVNPTASDIEMIENQ